MALMFYLLDKDMEIKRIIETYKSAIWTERYYERGDFELYIPATVEIIADLNFDSSGSTQYIVRADDTTKCAMIESVKISTDADNGNFITVSGHTLDALAFRRVVTSQTTYTGSAAKIIERLITKSIVSPDAVNRAIANFSFKNSIEDSDRALTAQYCGENVGEAVEAISKTIHTGYRVNFDIDNKTMEFEIYEGADRSLYQQDNPPVIFSNDFNNLLTSNYTVSVENWRNNALVIGEGQGSNRVRVEFGEDNAGIERREVYVNEQESSTNGGEITKGAYMQVLYDRGYQACAENRPLRETEADVAPNYGFKLGVDYFLGDIVSVENEYGVKITPRVVETIEAQDDNGYSIIPTFAID